VERVDGPNFIAYRADISVKGMSGERLAMFPEKRNYKAGGQVMTEAAIDARLDRDLYVSLGEPLQGDAWAMRFQVKPLVRCIWLGSLLIAIGGLLAAFDKRYRRHKKVVKDSSRRVKLAYE
jgi:cytochrome c-type biogenesis protein CcmF